MTIIAPLKIKYNIKVTLPKMATFKLGLTQNAVILPITPSEPVDIRGIYELSRLHKLTVYATMRKFYILKTRT